MDECKDVWNRACSSVRWLTVAIHTGLTPEGAEIVIFTFDHARHLVDRGRERSGGQKLVMEVKAIPKMRMPVAGPQ